MIVHVRDEQGPLLAEWFLLTNVPIEVPAETIALWYYWRWRIESFHKLLKSGGHHITTMPPDFKAGARCCSTQARSSDPLIGPSTVSGARNPSARSAPRNGVACQRPQGVYSPRVPRSERPSRPVRLVLAHVSSLNTTRAGSI